MPLMLEILRYAKKFPIESDPALVEAHLKTVANLHRWAPWLEDQTVHWLQECEPNHKHQRFIDIEDTIRKAFTRSASLIPPRDFDNFATRPELLKPRLERGWILMSKLWPVMKDDERKEFVCDNQTGLHHEKGYHHVLEDLKTRAFKHALIGMDEL